jgi:hypothetical protein
VGLSSVPTPPEEQRKRRTFEEITRDIYNDRRADLEQRELLLAMAYALYASGKGIEDVIPEACRVLGRQYGIARYDRLIRADIPRYKPPEEAGDWGPSNAPACQAPRLRPYQSRPYRLRTQPDPDAVQPTPIRQPTPAIVHVDPGYTPPRDWRTEDGVCGAPSNLRVLEKDPRTGWVTAHWFCKRHKDHADRVTEQVRAQNEAAPEPVPNKGGLLPCYFKADWEKVYRHYAGKHWEPPSYGLCADDWPTPGQMSPVRRRLRVVIPGDETTKET